MVVDVVGSAPAVVAARDDTAVITWTAAPATDRNGGERGRHTTSACL
ncbi:hypothetical protein ACF1HJ_31650 [Streptomyces sp. NPDC013978]